MTTTTANNAGLFKVVYNEKVIREMIPDINKVHKTFPLTTPTKAFGKEFRVPVQITYEAGFTGAVDDTAFTLNGASSRKTPEATITSSTLVSRSAMSYDAMQKALHALNGKNGKEAFVNLTKDTVEARVRTDMLIAEIQYLYGCGSAANDALGSFSNLGEIESAASVSSGVYDVVIKDQHWAPGIWQGKDGDVFRVDVRDTSGAQITSTTYPTITKVTFSSRTLRLTGTEADLANIDPGDHLFWAGDTQTLYEREMVGLTTILQNTGELFGIDVADYALWGANQFTLDTEQPLTLPLLLQACQGPVNMGFSGELVAVVSNATWQDIMNDEASLVEYTGGSKDKYERGSRKLSFTFGDCSVTLMAHTCMKRGMAMILPKAHVKRLGANEGTFNMPTGEQGKLFRELENSAGTELRHYWNKGIYITCPRFATIITNIAPSTPVA